MEKTGKWSVISLINTEFCTKVKDEKILSTKEVVVLVIYLSLFLSLCVCVSDSVFFMCFLSLSYRDCVIDCVCVPDSVYLCVFLSLSLSHHTYVFDCLCVYLCVSIFVDSLFLCVFFFVSLYLCLCV